MEKIEIEDLRKNGRQCFVQDGHGRSDMWNYMGPLGVQLNFKVIHGDIHGNLVGGALEPWNLDWLSIQLGME